jgi:hypothetical protein
MLTSPAESVGDTASQMCFINLFMAVLGGLFISYGIFGGKEPEIGMIKKTEEKNEKQM